MATTPMRQRKKSEGSSSEAQDAAAAADPPASGGRSLLMFAGALVLVLVVLAAGFAGGERGGGVGVGGGGGVGGGRDPVGQDLRMKAARTETKDAAGGEAADAGGAAAAADGITKGSVAMRARDPRPKEELPFLYCGPRHPKGPGTELVLLHGAKFTKEDWRKSGILAKLCEGSGGRLSATALDLSIKADGPRLADALEALERNELLSGDPVAIVSPSASGRAMVSLGEMAASKEGGPGGGMLKRWVKAWIPVACGSVLGAKAGSIRAYKEADVPILAVHGTKDKGGRDATERLVKEAGAKGLELEGGHPCYLDSPDDFVRSVLAFIGLKGDADKRQ